MEWSVTHEPTQDELKTQFHVLQQRYRHLAEELTLAEYRVQRRIGEYVHDHVQQLVVGARLRATALHGKLGGVAPEELGILEGLLDEVQQSVRNVSHSIAPPIDVHRNVKTVFGWLVEHVQRLHGLTVKLHVDGPFDTLPEAKSLFLFTAARELLFNVAKHAGTDRASLRLGWCAHHVVLEVRDRGAGFDPHACARDAAHSLGMFSLKKRAALFGGGALVHSKPGEGTRALVSVPHACKRRDGVEALPTGRLDGANEVSWKPA